MEDIRSRMSKLLMDAEDFDLIANLATDRSKRDAFRRLAVKSREMAGELQALIEGQSVPDAKAP